MKLYNVYVYSTRTGLDIYMVRADDPVDAWEIVEVIEVKEGA